MQPKNEHDAVKEMSINFLADLKTRFEDRTTQEMICVGLSSLTRVASLLILPIDQPFRETILESFFGAVREGLEQLDQEVVPEFFANQAIEKAMKK